MQRRPFIFRWLAAWLLLSILVGIGFQVQAAPLRAVQGDVVINEVAWGGTVASDEDEWIELYINTTSVINLDQWRITSSPLPLSGNTPNIDIIISDTANYTNGDYYLLEREIDSVVSTITANQIYKGPNNLLDDAGETLYLYAPDGSGGYDLIDTANGDGGSWPAGIASGYGSMERYANSYTASEKDSFWVTNVNESTSEDFRGNKIHGTPKAANWATIITPISTTIINSTDPNPSIPNLSVKVTVTVSGGPTTPTGTVAISGADTNCSITLTSSNNGSGSCNVQFASIGSKTLTANYTPTSDHTASSDTHSHEVVNPISTKTTITNINPSPGFVDEDVTVSVKVEQASGSTKPSGQVSITGANTNCTATLSNGLGSCVVRFNTVGAKTLIATYTGYGAFTSSVDNKDDGDSDNNSLDVFYLSTTTITGDNPDPSLTTENVTVSVKVTGESITPAGTVEITGATTNCTITLSDGTGSCDVRITSAGTKTLKATYNGDETYFTSSDTESHSVSFASSSSGSSSGFSSGDGPDPILGISEFLPRPGHDWNNDGIVDVFDEFIEIINAGSVDVDLSNYKLDDEEDLGSSPFTLPSMTLKPGERAVFYASETGILLSDAGDTVRLLEGSRKVVDAYTYNVVRYPDQSWCRIPDRLGYWNKPCFPTPGNPNALTGNTFPPKPELGYLAPVCLLPDSTPAMFVYAECEEFGDEIWSYLYWNGLDFAEQRKIYDPDKWGIVFE